MFNPLSIDQDYDSLEYLNKLGAYNANSGVDELLDLMREIQESGNYYYQGLVFPNLDTIPVVGAQVTINGTQIVPPGTFVIGMSSYSQQTAGFNLKVYDKGSKASVFYGDYANHRVVAGRFDTTFGLTPDVPSGPKLLMEPFIVTGPGVLGWEIVNLATVDNQVQVLIDCAVPITNRSVHNLVVNR